MILVGSVGLFIRTVSPKIYISISRNKNYAASFVSIVIIAIFGDVKSS